MVVTKDPSRPPTDRTNIKMVYEVKFDGDQERDGQFDAQRKISGERKGGPQKFKVLDAASCGCTSRADVESALAKLADSALLKVLNAASMREWMEWERAHTPQPDPPPPPDEYQAPGPRPGYMPGGPNPVMPGDPGWRYTPATPELPVSPSPEVPVPVTPEVPVPVTPEVPVPVTPKIPIPVRPPLIGPGQLPVEPLLLLNDAPSKAGGLAGVAPWYEAPLAVIAAMEGLA
ncbi:MAG: hypothetical protein U0414_43455 [Polyangiaceae bacterium]